jgi:hypothetical protein
MSVSDLLPGTGHWDLAVRICGRLIGEGGRMPNETAVAIAKAIGISGQLSRRPDGRSRGSRHGQAVARVVSALRDLDLVYRDDGDIVAKDLADVAAWVADELDQEEARDSAVLGEGARDVSR